MKTIVCSVLLCLSAMLVKAQAKTVNVKNGTNCVVYFHMLTGPAPCNYVGAMGLYSLAPGAGMVINVSNPSDVFVGVRFYAGYPPCSGAAVGCFNGIPSATINASACTSCATITADWSYAPAPPALNMVAFH